MRRFLPLLLLLTLPARAAVVFDAFAVVAYGVDPSTTIAAGTPHCAVLIAGHAASEPLVSVTYGGSSMGSAVASVTNAAGGEAVGVEFEAFILNGPPSGSQTVAIDTGANGGKFYVYTLTTTANDCALAGSASIDALAQTNPSTTLSLGGNTSFVAEAWLSGSPTTGGVTPFAGWTSRAEEDMGSVILGSYSYNTIGSTNVTVGVTHTTQDILLLAVGVYETAGGGSSGLLLIRRRF